MNSGIVSPDEVWQLAHWVASLGPRETPPLREVVRVSRSEGALPADGSDEAWDDVEAFFFPLAGQVVEQAPAMTDEGQQAPPTVVVLLVHPQVLGQVVDAIGEQSHLHLG